MSGPVVFEVIENNSSPLLKDPIPPDIAVNAEANPLNKSPIYLVDLIVPPKVIASVISLINLINFPVGANLNKNKSAVNLGKSLREDITELTPSNGVVADSVVSLLLPLFLTPILAPDDTAVSISCNNAVLTSV